VITGAPGRLIAPPRSRHGGLGVHHHRPQPPHGPLTVDPPQNGVITCPNHFSQFDGATGALRKGPADTGLTEVPVRVVDDYVQV
jgi:cytochrome b6-f complex iron-sulfur subunit